MNAVLERSAGAALTRSVGRLFRRRLMSRRDVKRTQSAGRSQNRQLGLGGGA